MELNRRREQEIMKLKKDLEIVLGDREMTETALRKRHQEAVNELTQQLENSNRKSTKYVHSHLLSARNDIQLGLAYCAKIMGTGSRSFAH